MTATSITQQNVSRETLHSARNLYELHSEKLELYIDQLLWWNERVNLVSRDVSRETIKEHVVHSLIPVALGLIDSTDQWIDAGTGGGLPGIPLAIVSSEKNWVLNDIVAKKIAAVKQLIHKLELSNIIADTGSIENQEAGKSGGIITKHAFKTRDLIEMIEGKPWKKIIMYKGSDEAEQELKELENSYKYKIYRFDFGNEEAFYKGKGIVVIEKEMDI